MQSTQTPRSRKYEGTLRKRKVKRKMVEGNEPNFDFNFKTHRISETYIKSSYVV